MGTLGRCSLRSSVGFVVAGALLKPTTAIVRWTQGFEEDVAFKKIVKDYEKASSNSIDYSIISYAPLRQIDPARTTPARTVL